MFERWTALTVLLSCLWLLTAARGGPPDNKPDEKGKTAEALKVDLSRLPNDELVKQAAAIHAKGSGDYLAAVRALAGAEAQLDDANKQLADLTPPKTEPKRLPDTPKSKDTLSESEDLAKAAVDTAKRKADFTRQKHKLTLAVKQLQSKVAAAVETLQFSVGAFQAAIDDLKPYAVEFDLRIKDNTFDGKIPIDTRLLPGSLALKRKEIVVGQDRLRDRLAEARRAIETTSKVLEEDEKAVNSAEAEAIEAERTFAREQQRKEIEKKYAGKKPGELLRELNLLVRDGIGLKGTYELAYGQFSTRAAETDKLRQVLGELKQPEVKITEFTRVEDVQLAVKSVEALIAYCNTRMQMIEKLKAKLVSLGSSGGEFEANASVSDDHMFKMQIVACLLDKAGDAGKLPDQAGLKRLAEAAERAKRLAAEVRAATEKAKKNLAELDKDSSDTKSAGASAVEQLASFKQTQEATLAALRFEEQLGKISAAQAIEEFNKLHNGLANKATVLTADEKQYKDAAAATAEARLKFEVLKDPLLRAAEELGQTEKQKIRAELRKEAGLDRAVQIAPVNPLIEGKKPDEKKPDEKEKKTEVVLPSPLERVTAQLASFQQQLAARDRVLDEREQKAKALLLALDELERTASTYSKTLADARLAALQLNAAAGEIKRRVGRNELEAAKIPLGVTDSLRMEGRKKLDSDFAAVLNSLSQTKLELATLRKTDPEATALKAMAKELLGVVGQRIDLLGDLKKLGLESRLAMKDRSVSEQKRFEQSATERMDKESGGWDWLLALDRSKPATNIVELLESYYRELKEIEEKEIILKKERDKIDELIELNTRERMIILKGVPLLEKELSVLDASREEEMVLTRARLKPEIAEDLLKAFQTKTGRVLTKPLPLGEKDQSERVDELAEKLFERYIEIEAVKKWSAILNDRLGTAGLTAEAGIYQDELAELNAAAGANARRVTTLTGNAPAETGKLDNGERSRQPALGGEIARARGELRALRTRGVQKIGIEIGTILLVAFFLPRVVVFVLRRAIGGSEDARGSSMVLSAVGTFLKVIVWVVAIAMILNSLGFDVTAIVAGLGIGGLAIGLAAQPMISDVIGAIIIFAERRFKIGDVVRFGIEEPARVVGLTWRSTALKNPDGLLVSIPNRKVTEATIQNMTRSGQTFDSLSATVTTDKDVAQVVAVIKKAMDACENLSADHGVSVKKFTHKGISKMVEYRFWWFLKDYESRNKTRDEVFGRIGAELAHEDMAGTELTLV